MDANAGSLWATTARFRVRPRLLPCIVWEVDPGQLPGVHPKETVRLPYKPAMARHLRDCR